MCITKYVVTKEATRRSFICYKVPTSSGNHGIPGKSPQKSSMHGKIMEFEKKTEYSSKNNGIL